jgi:hypothetical protein
VGRQAHHPWVSRYAQRLNVSTGTSPQKATPASPNARSEVRLWSNAGEGVGPTRGDPYLPGAYAPPTFPGKDFGPLSYRA